MRVVSLFAGIGGFDYPLIKLGHQIVYANEWDKYASLIYGNNFECKPDTRDIATVPSSEIPEHDLLCGGFPCQSFSIAGKRGGFNDTRGTLFFEIARILRDKRPRYLLLENVKGLLTHESGKTFSTILGVLADLGYECEWQVLNSKDFGVPQNRERVFIVGNLREVTRAKIFPILKDDSIFDKPIEPNEGQTQTEISSTVRVKTGKADDTYILSNIYGGFKETEARIHKEVSPTIRTAKGGGHIPSVLKDAKIRRLTPIECERLQGFPDDWTKYGGLYLDKDLMKMRNLVISDTQRYKCLGNAVTTNVIYEIARRAFNEI